MQIINDHYNYYVPVFTNRDELGYDTLIRLNQQTETIERHHKGAGWCPTTEIVCDAWIDDHHQLTENELATMELLESL